MAPLRSSVSRLAATAVGLSGGGVAQPTGDLGSMSHESPFHSALQNIMPEEPEAAEPTLVDEQRYTDYIFAARQGDVATVKQLLSEGIPVGFRDPSGWTALRWSPLHPTCHRRV